jgi:hypothetical protein
MERKELPEPECELGYTESQLKTILNSRYKEFMSWMSGQTMALCDGRAYDYELDLYRNTGCGPHGGVVYYWDLKRFLDGKPVVD